MVTKLLRLLLVFSLPIGLLFISNCKKEGLSSSQVSFSKDTLTFDTVFATLGSTTKSFKIFNRDSKPVKITDIRLMHLVGTQFRINVDGVPGDHFTNIEIPAKDSIYVFAEVTVDPQNTNTPYVIIDDVQLTVNGNVEKVHLQAFGQIAHFHYGETITSDVTWDNDIPHVVIANDSVPGVIVNCGATLTIKPGCKVFFANNAALFVAGNLNAVATSWSDSIVFRGVRLEQFYVDKPGQWFGIVFLRTGQCTPTGVLTRCVIDESSYGIYAGAGLSTNLADYAGANNIPNVTIDKCIVKNTQNNAVYGFNATINATNSLFYAAGDNMMKFGLGGTYNFTNCTIYNTGSRYVDHQKETVLLSNLVSDGTNTYVRDLNTNFNQCVVYGNLDNEIAFSNEPQGAFNNTFTNCLLKAKQDSMANSVINSVIFNQDPQFVEQNRVLFTPSDTNNVISPLLDAAPASSQSTDLFDRNRGQLLIPANGATPNDIGAIERQP